MYHVLYLFLWTLNNLSVSGFFSVDFGVWYVFVNIATYILPMSGPASNLQTEHRCVICSFWQTEDGYSRSVSVFSFLSLVFIFEHFLIFFNFLFFIFTFFFHICKPLEWKFLFLDRYASFVLLFCFILSEIVYLGYFFFNCWLALYRWVFSKPITSIKYLFSVVLCVFTVYTLWSWRLHSRHFMAGNTGALKIAAFHFAEVLL